MGLRLRDLTGSAHELPYKWPPRRRTAHEENLTRRRTEAVRLVGRPGCPVCRARGESLGHWMSAFVNENHTDGDVIVRYRRSLGFCPGHTRGLLTGRSASWLMPTVLEGALAAGARMLAGGPREILGCPLCENLRHAEDATIATLGRAFPDAAVRDAYAEGTGTCAPHAVRLAGILPSRHLPVVVTTLRRRLEEHGSVSAVAGTGADAAARHAVHERAADGVLAAEKAALGRSAYGLVETDIDTACCPVCRAETRAAWRYLRWLLRTGDGGPAREDRELCPRHLHDARRIDPEGVRPVLAAMTALWTGRLDRSLSEARHREALTAMRGRASCRACAAAAGAGRRAVRLLEIALADDTLDAAYGRSHGVCLRHGLTWTGSRAGRVHAVLGARLEMAVFELGESRRKSDWNTRFEPRGAEMSAWSQAPTLLDGRIYCGCTAAEAR
ncbi:hypothetical protein [Actinomadura sp. DC4]|uniref:hypothetical protein n=1 Tax=Actinomadura sp. DC4 TaxID=3055069 RepID=UPI0025B0FD0C|nr:hypothetical protein [Actinomadura sp. DC4]MDN3356364.1 hypothetical protein [Actinomadura sp. DC4]